MDLLSIILSWNPIDWVLDPVKDIKETLDLVMLGFKIVVLLFIIQFTRGRFGGGPLVTILVLVIGYIMLFSLWPIFGPMMLIYFIIAFGFINIVFDLVIAKPWAGGGEGEAHMTGKQYAEETGKRRNIQRRLLP